jgi:DNA primase
MDHAQEVVHMSLSQTKSKFIEFQALKQKVKIEDAMALLGLKVSTFSDQMRSSCPACRSGGDRALVITASKSVFYCFAAGEGGDVIALVSHIKGVPMKDAAAILASSFDKHTDVELVATTATVPSTVPEKKKAGLNPLTYLQPEHPSVRALGISPETAKHFGAGYASKGIMRGRFAIPIHDAQGQLVAYCGRSVSDESPAYIFPSGFQPNEHIFNAHQVREGPLTLVREPLLLLKAHEGGINNVVAFLSDTLSAQQLEMLSSLMDEQLCESIELF